MSRAVQPGGTSGPTPLDLDLLLTGAPPGPASGPSMGFTTPSQPQMSPQGAQTPRGCKAPPMPLLSKQWLRSLGLASLVAL